MIDPPDTFWVICNTPLPIRDKYLINTYLLNLIPDKDWIVCIGACCIRPTNSHDHGQMIDPPGTCWGVCNTPLHILNKYLINKYLLNLISGKDWMVRVGAYCIRPTNSHDHGQMINQPGTCWDVCNTPLPIPDKYLINTYLLNPIPEKDWIVWIIMPIKPGTFLDVCNTPLPIRIKNLIPL